MARGPSKLKVRDVRTLVRALVEAGCNVARIDLDKDGKISVVTSDAPGISPHGDELDKELADFKERHGGQGSS